MMTKTVYFQLQHMLKKQKKLFIQTFDPVEKSMICGMWSGFLAGLKLSGSINAKEYNSFFDKLIDNSKTEKRLA